MPANPLDDPELERSETALRAALFGVVAGGVFGKIRNPPRSPYFSGLLRRRDTGAVLGSRWWQDSWAWLHAKTDPLLTRIARDAGSAAVREFAAGLVEERALTAALATAEGQAAAMVAEIQATSAATLQELISDLGARDIATARLRDELAARLGPTPRQLARIRRWEEKARLAGLSRREILIGARSRAAGYSRIRAGTIASDALAGQANAARSAAFAESGLLVYSANVGDNRVRPLHRRQTVVTLASPAPAGEPWAPAAPFVGLPPYEFNCRCWVQPSSKSLSLPPEDEGERTGLPPPVL